MMPATKRKAKNEISLHTIKHSKTTSRASAVLWYLTVKEYGPTNITHTHMYNGEWVAMEYGIAENEEFPPLIVPERDLTPDEALFIVEAWTQMAGEGDFDIETSNQYRQQGSRNFDNSLILSPK